MMKQIILITTAFAMVSCTTTNSLTSSSTPPSEFKLRSFQEKTLPNGLRLLVLKDKSLPRVGFSLLVNAGSKNDPKGLAGLNSMTAGLLEFGTTKQSATQIADSFGFLGTEFSSSAGKDYSFFATSGLSQYKEKLLALFADLIMNPSFEFKELERMKSQSVASLRKLSDNPSPMADALNEKSLYLNHPYGRLTIGDEASISKISKSDLISHYLKYFRPNRAFLAITGDVDDQFIAHVESVFSKWKTGDTQALTSQNIEPITNREYMLFTKPGLQQSQIRISQFSVPRNNPDFLKIRLTNLILGGSFSSRLMQHVRDDLGLTYSISSSLDAREEAGLFSISTFSRNEKVAQTIQESLKVFEEFTKNGVTSKELESAKALIIGQFPSAIETTDKLAYNLLILRRYGVSDSYLEEFNKNVNSITLNDINQVIQKYYTPEKLKVIVYADQEKVLTDLKGMADFKVEAISSSF